jgi:hypothetical protein
VDRKGLSLLKTKTKSGTVIKLTPFLGKKCQNISVEFARSDVTPTMAASSAAACMAVK